MSMDYTDNISVLDKMPWLAEKRKKHIISTADTARKLAEIFCPENAARAYVAGLYHDCAKGLEKELLHKYDVGLFGDFLPTVHAPIGAYLARDFFGVDDSAVLDAIMWHCTGKPNMTDLEKIIFLADAIEPLREYPNVDKIREETFSSLDKGVISYLENLISYLSVDDGSKINPYTLQCYDFYRRIND